MHTTELHHIQQKHQVSYTIMEMILAVHAVDAISIGNRMDLRAIKE